MNIRFPQWAGLAPLAIAGPLAAQTTAFTYQGRLWDQAAPANGVYDFQFAVYDAATNGTAVSTLRTNSGVSVSGGLFTATVDFGAAPFQGGAVWLEVAARTNGAANFTELAPRVFITSVPGAIYAANSATALSLSGTVPSAGLGGTYGSVVSFTNGANIFAGNGSGLAGVPGTLTAQLPPGTAVQAMPNVSYLLTNNQLVTVTLPTAPNPGDTVRVAGTGTGGWKLAQNPGQAIIGANLINPLTYWTDLLAIENGIGRGIGCSADGTHIISTYTGYIDISSDSGATWRFPNLFIGDGPCAALSADGRWAVVTTFDQPIIVSGDFETNWVVETNSVSALYSGVTMSADGSHLFASVNGGGIYASTNYGTNWSLTSAVTNTWVAIAASAGGSKVAAASASGSIYLSSDYGASWQQSAAPDAAWVAICCSADGSRLIALGGSATWISTDSGQSWQSVSLSGGQFYSIACSADGQRVVAAGQGILFVSTDGGLNWFQGQVPALPWRAAACSATGNFTVNSAGEGIWAFKTATTTGTSGYLTGGPYSVVELEYVGSGQFLPVSHEGTLLNY